MECYIYAFAIETKSKINNEKKKTPLSKKTTGLTLCVEILCCMSTYRLFHRYIIVMVQRHCLHVSNASCIFQVNGTLVTSSNHAEVVKLIKGNLKISVLMSVLLVPRTCSSSIHPLCVRGDSNPIIIFWLTV